AMRQNIRQRANMHADVAIKRAHPAHRLGQVIIPGPAAVFVDESRCWQEWGQLRFDGYRARAGSATAMWSGKSLMQIEMHHIHAEVARTRDSYQCVHVGAVHVNQPAFGVQDFSDPRDVLLEYS